MKLPDLRIAFLLVALAFTWIMPPVAQATDLSITTTSFLTGANAKTKVGKAGAAITIGQLLYFDETAGTWKLCDANASAAAAKCGGIAGSAAASGQDVIVVLEDDDLTLGATLSMSAPIYVPSATAGGIAPVADLTTGWYPSVIIIAKSTTKCIFKPAAIRGTAVTADTFDVHADSRLAFVVRPAGRPVALPSRIKHPVTSIRDLALSA